MEGCSCTTCKCGERLIYEIPKNQNLIQLGDFPLHSGGISYFKIECDKFTQSDWDALAILAAKRWKYRTVHGIPTGGMRLANAMQKYATLDPKDPTIIVDDVLTTGGSMIQAKLMYKADVPVIGFVAIARGPTLPWVIPFFQIVDGWE